jgi:hypothetical protein
LIAFWAQIRCKDTKNNWNMQIFWCGKVKKTTVLFKFGKKGKKHKPTDLPYRTDFSSLKDERKMIREIRSKMNER